MEFVVSIIMGVVGGAARQAGQGLYSWVKQFLHNSFKDQSETKVLQALEQIGNLSDADIRKRVEELAKVKKLPDAETEELTALLINLAHGARFHTTQGTLRSSFVRHEALLDQLLKCVLPKRHKGEPVATNGMPDWKLARFLGMGSFGEVWEVRTPNYPDPYAVKFFTSPDSAQWIKAEQHTLFHVKQKLPKHPPNLVSFLDVALTGKPYPYLVFDYADGGSLEDWILSHEKDRPRLDRCALVEGVVRGLAEAHRHGIAHRDLKPANILLAAADGNGVPKITDFGLGRVEAQSAGVSAQASQGAVVGTSAYLPPEAVQAFVKRSPEQDDVFAAGVVWYQLLVGRLERPPYDFADGLREHLVDSQTIRIVERCLAQPARRYKHAGELEDALESIPEVPDWEPIPPDCFDVQHLAREYLGSKV